MHTVHGPVPEITLNEGTGAEHVLAKAGPPPRAGGCPARRQTQDEAPASPARAVAILVAGLALAADEDQQSQAAEAHCSL
jgi:hypothetical protein